MRLECRATKLPVPAVRQPSPWTGLSFLPLTHCSELARLFPKSVTQLWPRDFLYKFSVLVSPRIGVLLPLYLHSHFVGSPSRSRWGWGGVFFALESFGERCVHPVDRRVM